MRILPLFLVAAATFSQTPKPSGLDRLLEAEPSRFPAKTGLYVKHLTSGEESIHIQRVADCLNAGN
jgi:hypothetical protein